MIENFLINKSVPISRETRINNESDISYCVASNFVATTILKICLNEQKANAKSHKKMQFPRSLFHLFTLK